MGKDSELDKQKKQLQEQYVQLVLSRIIKAQNNFETTRIVIDVQKGKINSIQDQVIIAGATALDYYLDTID